MNEPQPWPDWTGETAVIVATGPSAKNVNLELARGRARFLAIKDAWRLCPWAELLYGCDHHWWEANKAAHEYRGIRVVYAPETIKRWPAIKFLKVDIASAHDLTLQFGKVGKVGWGGNSGFHAINLAVQFGAKRLVLVGFDMRVDKGKHFFGTHKYGEARPNEKTVAMWRQILDAQAPLLSSLGVEVINCSLVSALQAYPKLAFEDVFAKTEMGQPGAQAVGLDRF